MKQSSCTHLPHVVRRTFDIGFEKLAVYELCKNCKEIPNFRDYIVSEEILEKNNCQGVIL